MDQIVIMAIMLVVSWVAMVYLGWTLSRRWNKPETVGTLRIYIGDPDGLYMTLESYVIPEYIMTQKEVTLSVDVTDVSQK